MINSGKLYSGRRALITGSTRGIGLAIARRLADGGADLVLNYKDDQPNADTAVKEITSKGVRCIAIRADMSDSRDCRRFVEDGIAFLNGLDFLIHNAGPFEMDSIAEAQPGKWRYLLDANYSAGVNVTQGCIEELRKSDYPCIVYIGGVNTGVLTSRHRTFAYSAAKAALAVLMRTVALEEGPNGIRANMVCPGYIDTGNYSEDFLEKAVEKIPLRHIGEPDDVAAPVCWLLTREAGYVTGTIIDAGGGLWM